jgi:hypothetical protein
LWPLACSQYIPIALEHKGFKDVLEMHTLKTKNLKERTPKVYFVK